MDLYHLPGFLGTKAHFLSDLTLVFIILSAILLTVGVWLAIRKKYEIHRWVQNAAVILNASVILGVMIGSFRGYYLPKIPANLSDVPIAVMAVHALIGVFGFLFGTFVMLRGNNYHTKDCGFQITNCSCAYHISYI